MSGITSRDFKRKEHYEFYNELRAADPSGGRHFYKLFEDFLTLSATALRQGVEKFMTGKIDDELEKRYLEVVKSYDPEKSKAFSRAFGCLTLGLEVEVHDFLGDVAGSAGVLNKWSGQYFTPWNICQLMTRMTFEKIKKDPHHRLTVQEPAVGGGAMLLSVAQYLQGEGFKPWNWWFDATDIDVKCFYMSYIQLTLCWCPGIVRHGNSITLEEWRTWPTLGAAMFPHYWETDKGEEEKPTLKLPDTETKKKIIAEQLTLL